MRKYAFFVAFLVALAAAGVALASGDSPSFTFSSDEQGATYQCSIDGGAASACSSPKSYSSLTPGQHTVTITSTFTVPQPSGGGSTVLLGDQTVEGTSDGNNAGSAQAWPYVASSSGDSASVSFYVGNNNSATTGQLGVYDDNAGKPGKLLGSATFAPKKGAWNTVNLTGASVVQGNTYWLAALGTAGFLGFVDKAANTCNSAGSTSGSLTSLPSSGGFGYTWPSCPASFYLSGAAGPPPAAPTNSTAPSISGTAQDGQTLTADKGTWTNSPTSYSYQWQDCTSSTSCTNISGATNSTYAVQTSDVGNTIDVVVKATNAGGSNSATSAQTQTVSAAPAPSSAGLHVVGNQIKDVNNSTVVLHGTDVSGSSYACEQNGGYGFSDTPTGDSLYQPMSTWKINSNTLLLNQDCWLGINGANSTYSGQNYINYVKSEVASMEKYGIYPVLVFGEGAPGTQQPNYYATDAGEAAMPNNDHFPLLWQELANTFKNDQNVIFRLYEEPYPNNTGTDLATWKCWSQGDMQYSTSSDNLPSTAPTPVSQNTNCNENYGGAYKSVGMQSLVNIIRGTGAKNIIQIPGVAFANALSCSNTGSPTSCGFLDSADGVKVNDPIVPAQLMADTDNYPDSGQFCGSTACLDATYGPVAQVMPIDMGEAGTMASNGAMSVIQQFVNWYDSKGQSYYGSQWETWSNFITNYNGTPGAGWGQWFHDHIQ